MKNRPSDADVTSIMNSMHIEGFMVTEDEVREALQEFYDNDEPGKLDELIPRLKTPGVDPVARMRQHALLMEQRARKA